jgi:8-oxo-dGTP diphosphatase
LVRTHLRYYIAMSAKNVSVLILYKADGRLLLQHRTNDAPTFPDYWAFFGGGVEECESAEGAVKRESLEELGYELTSPFLFTTLRFFHQENEHMMHVFIEKYSGGILTLGEGQAMGWFLPGETKDLMMNNHDRSVIQALASVLTPGG